MRIYAFENFPWLPWAEIAVMLLMILLIVLAIRARRQLWKILLTLCVPVLVIISCAGGAVAIFIVHHW